MPHELLVATPFGIGALPEEDASHWEGDGVHGDTMTRVRFPWGLAYLNADQIAKAPEFTFYALTPKKRVKFTLQFPLTAYGQDMVDAVRKELELSADVAITLVQTDSVSKHDIKPDMKIGDCTIAADPQHPILVLKAPLVRFDEGKCSYHAVIQENRSAVIQIAKGFGSVLGNCEIRIGVKYWEVELQATRGGDGVFIGVGPTDLPLNGSILNRGVFWGISCVTGHKLHDTIDYYSEPFRDGDVVGVLLDMEHGRLTFYKNGRNLGVAFSGIQTKVLCPVFSLTFIGQKLKLLPTASAPLS
ncbi:hypothetical protein Poli38472_000941 [Pythium oligandrum]|uniref:B30.2/SPRY domain-containing protein n=1 Tax=Pythium oligandrum TaxID=41045 RepID=A0A8K1FHD3_PYTOL|nr:hypothetical protein Poli38472_000941 [Pythium oligandrum]|eukprot:TMW60899.1 hypothetical protein Poli38472_000941 [Pythium oligandrum]